MDELGDLGERRGRRSPVVRADVHAKSRHAFWVSERMTEDELAASTEAGVVELEISWPEDGRALEVPIPRVVAEPDGSERAHRTLLEYFSFLRTHVRPLALTLEAEAGIRYWHILNHGMNTDLRLLIEHDDQRRAVSDVLANSGTRLPHCARFVQTLKLREKGPNKDRAVEFGALESHQQNQSVLSNAWLVMRKQSQ
jgi:hypothetical protein